MTCLTDHIKYIPETQKGTTRQQVPSLSCPVPDWGIGLGGSLRAAHITLQPMIQSLLGEEHSPAPTSGDITSVSKTHHGLCFVTIVKPAC